jgi:hypothetical protein
MHFLVRTINGLSMESVRSFRSYASSKILVYVFLAEKVRVHPQCFCIADKYQGPNCMGSRQAGWTSEKPRLDYLLLRSPRIFGHLYPHVDRCAVTHVYSRPPSPYVSFHAAKIAYFREDHSCVIGLRTIATIPLLTYDVFLNLFLTSLFVWPLLRRQLSTDKLRQLATRTCWYVLFQAGYRI